MPLNSRRLLGTNLAAALALALLAVLVPGAPTYATGAVDGPDVASFQHPGGRAIDWGQVRAAGAEFGFVKATEGASYTNPYFANDYAGLKAAGMARGAYAYARPSAAGGLALSARAQARHFVAVTGSLTGAGELPAVLDLETNGGLGVSSLIAWTDAYLSEVAHLTGRTPIVYTYPAFWRSSMGNTTRFADHPLWLATYGSQPQLIGGWKSYMFWQYTDSSTTPGIAGRVDRSVFAGTTASLNQLARMTPALPAPGAPTQLTAAPTAAGSRTLAVTWAKPRRGGSPATYRVALDGQVAVTLPASATRATLAGATPGSHAVTVTALNAAGSSRAATARVLVVVKVGAPTNLTVAAAGTRLSVAWAPPVASAGELIGYRVTVDAQPPVALRPSATSYADPGRVPGQHTVRVVAYNRLGDGAPASGTALVVVRPDAPTQLTVHATGTTLTGAWLPPATSPGELTGYRVLLDGAPAASLPPTARTYAATNLVPGPHTFSVHAYNRAGEGTDASMVGTVIVRPSAPRALRTSVTGTQVTTAWDQPDALGGELLGYHVRIDNGPVRSVTAAQPAYTATGLAPGTHRISVSAYNSAGASSPVAVDTTVIIAPSSPTSVATLATAGSIQLTWSAPSETGGLLGGYLVWVDGGTAVTLPASLRTYTAAGLKPGTHVLEVAAFTSVGSSRPVRINVALEAQSNAPQVQAAGRGGAIDLTWVAPTQPGGHVVGYQVTMDGRTVATVGSEVLRYTATGVAPGQHLLSVAALNGAGVGLQGTATAKVLRNAPLTLKAAPARTGHVVTLTGSTDRALAGQVVVAQEWAGSQWRTAGQTRVQATGRYAVTLRWSKAHTGWVRVSMSPSSSHYAGVSGRVRVKTH